MRIGLDIDGGDYTPQESLKAALQFAEDHSDIQLLLFSMESSPDTLLSNVEWIQCEGNIGMHEHPTKAIREKTNAAISKGFQYLAGDKCDAFISAGNSGAVMVGALHYMKTLPGVLRPSIPCLFPRPDGGYNLCLDVGINADCKVEHLNQFAVFGTVYARLLLGVEEPVVGLLNIGEEEGKGNLLAKAAYESLSSNDRIQFIGNIEGRDVLSKKADVIVCDGFTGNILLKFAESFFDVFHGERKVEDEYLNRFNYELYGGTPLLGVAKPVIVGHGISRAPAFDQMLHLARRMIKTDFCKVVESEL